MEHDPFGPSALSIIANCSASYLASQGLDDLPSEVADRGTKCHEIVAKLIKNKLTDPMPDEDAEACIRAHQFFLTKRAEFEHSMAEGRPIINARVCVERRLGIKAAKYLTFGTPDVYIVIGDRAILIDWKFGHLDLTESMIAWQIGAYALGLHQQENVNHIEGFIYGARHGDIHEYTIREDRFNKIEHAIWTVIERAKNDPKFRLGPWCRYCKANGACEETRKKALEIVAQFDVAEERTQTAIKNRIDEEVSKLPADRLLPMLEHCGILSAAIDAVKARAKMLLKSDITVPGWGLIKRKAAHRIDADMALKEKKITEEVWKAVTHNQFVYDKSITGCWMEKEGINEKEAKERIVKLFGEYPQQLILKRKKK